MVIISSFDFWKRVETSVRTAESVPIFIGLLFGIVIWCYPSCLVVNLM